MALGLMMMGDSWDVGVIGYVMPSMRAEWQLAPLATGGLIASGFAGQALGAILVGPLAERRGRLPVFSVAVVAMSLLSIGCALAPGPQAFTWLRFAQGLGFGAAVPVCATYVNELAPAATRGRYFSIYQFLMVCGFSLCGFVSAAVIPWQGWRAMFVIGAFPVLLVPAVLATLPESPRWLAGQGRVADLDRALSKLGARPIARGGPASPVQHRRIPLATLFEPPLRARTLATMLLWFLTSLVSYGFSTWVPTLYVEVFRLPLAEALRIAALTGIAYMLTPLGFALLLDRVGRRPAGIAFAAATLAVLAALTVLGRGAPALSIPLMALGWVTAAGSFTLLWPYTSEIFPTRARATALGLASATARGGSTLTPLVVGGLLARSGAIAPFFAALGAATLVVLALWLFAATEMARRPLEDLA